MQTASGIRDVIIAMTANDNYLTFFRYLSARWNVRPLADLVPCLRAAVNAAEARGTKTMRRRSIPRDVIIANALILDEQMTATAFWASNGSAELYTLCRASQAPVRWLC